MEGNNDMNNFVKSPLNYTGGKFKLLDEIIPLFPKHIDTFCDIFAGGFNVGVNVEAKRVIYNDIENHVVGLMEYLKQTDVEVLLEQIDSIISKYNLSKDNADGFANLRNAYNAGDDSPIMFYTMICYAFNYQIRFNSNGKYNMPFGKNRSSFNPALRQKFIAFVNALHNKDCTFINLQFKDFDYLSVNPEDFVYCDPPYFNSVAAYNENGGWSENDEKELLNILDSLNDRGIRFALSNNLKYENPLLDKWKDKYFVHYLNGDYSNCNYHKLDRSRDIEVLITNYK